MKKILVIVIATVLVLGVIGGCFALYYVGADEVEVNIGADYEEYTLQIKNGADGAQGAINLTFDPDENATKTVDLSLTVDDKDLANGDHGTFKVSVTGDLDDYLDVTVNTLTGKAGTVAADITADARSQSGKDFAISLTPIYVRLTFALNDDALADYTLAAGKTASLAVTWEVAEDSIWVYDATAYYLVGTINGENMWQVNPANKNLKLEDAPGNDVAVVRGVSLYSGDAIKIVWNYKGENNQSSIWYGPDGDDPTGPNWNISESGTYDIYLNQYYKLYAAKVGD